MSFVSKTNPLSKQPGKGNSARRKNPIITSPEDASLIEILDRVLDHGIFVEPASRLRLHALKLGRRLAKLVVSHDTNA